MNTEIFGVIAIMVLTVVFAIPLGKYIGKVYLGERTFADPFFNPIERLFFRGCGIDDKKPMTWQQNLVALLTINLLWFFIAMFILMNQGWLPFNPDKIPSMTPDLAFNTAISFLVNCNLQHYSGETGLSYFSQIGCMMFLQFVTAATGMAAAAVVFNAMSERSTGQPCNFYNYFLKSCTRVLLPLSLVTAIMLVFSGTPMTFLGAGQFVSLQGDTVQVARGPVAAMVAIKQTGTNGGGFFGTNSAHPFENPTYFTNMIEHILVLLIPVAMIFALGYYLQRKKLALVIFGVMMIGYLLLLMPAIQQEMSGNPAIAFMGINQQMGSMEGKEIRFGSAATAAWAIATTVTSNGSVNGMHDSLTPLSGMLAMLGMMVNSFFGGVGVGILNFYIFIIIAVFISGLMVGRTPEFLGKKVEAKEIKIAMIISLLHSFLVLTGTAFSSFLITHNPQAYAGWLNNPGYHGFSEVLYEFSSASANNGSGFEGLGDNTPWWNISCGIILLLSRYLPIIGPVAIAGILSTKKFLPETAGTLKTDTATFGLVVGVVILLVAALSFFPSLALGPIAEYFSIR